MQLRRYRTAAGGCLLLPFGVNLTIAILIVACPVNFCFAQPLTVTPYEKSGVYELGETAGWRVAIPDDVPIPKSEYSYTVKTNNQDVIKSGTLDLSSRQTKIEVRLDKPAMLYAEITPPKDSGKKGKPVVVGAAIAPTSIRPVASRPADFDEFWAAKIAKLKEIPPSPELTPGDSGAANVEYATITMNNIDSTHIHGQLARPKSGDKLPALVIFQWASPPYPLQKAWVTGPAAQGWLALNIEPHDVLPTEPPAYYNALPETIKHYESIGNNDRDQSYFLRMYLGDYRAVEYITSRPDWDGKTLVVMGISMGGQQSLCVAGLHPKVTHLIVDVPAGCDTNGPLHGRQSSYPNFPSNDPSVMRTALYFDAVNFAPRIKATSLVAMGFVDTISAPAGIWTAFNLIQGPKEVVPMIDSPHNHLATAEQQRPYTQRSAEWLNMLVKGEAVVPRKLAAADTAGKDRPDDHQNMMDQLGIKELRRGADPKDQETYNEATANSLKNTVPDVLTMNDGTRVSTAEQWPKRRAEILELFEREVFGRIPENVPKVAWRVTSSVNDKIGDVPTVTKTLVGHVDNSACPSIDVDIQATFTVPANAGGPVPLMIAFGRPFGGRLSAGRPGGVPWTQQAIEHGWGYAILDTQSIQPDRADGLRQGIIGLTAQGGPRKPDEWGALRAWQWGASRLVDYFESNADAKVDAGKVGIEGLSRYGKAALVTQAFDPRVAVGFIASSGEGGAKLYRHVFGETVENLSGGQFYWMAGNFLKYAAAQAKFGAKTTADLPVDSHELIALCAPRPCFISYGTVKGGDPNWVDARGSFMAGVLAGPVYRLLGKQDFGTSDDFVQEPMPPGEKLVGGELAWRQHSGGHDATPNWPSFFEWVARYIKAPANRSASGPASAEVRTGADQPAPRTDANSKVAHEQLLEKAKRGGIDVYFVGDSITRRWGCSDPQYAALLTNWRANFFGWNAGDFGWGGDTTQNILWRLNNGELDGVHPKVIVILAGTNNVGARPVDSDLVDDVAGGIRAIVDVCHKKAPDATIVLMAIFPRTDKPGLMPPIQRINERIAKIADGKRVRYLNVNDRLVDKDDKLIDGMLADGLHPTAGGYQVWADGLKPILTELLGPPAKTDRAPPPTGDPGVSASAK